MATLESLEKALRQKASAIEPSSKQSLTEAQYSSGFNIMTQGTGWIIYQEFVIPQLCRLLISLFNSRVNISVLEIGPGPKSVLGHLPKQFRRKVIKYAAFEPNGLFAAKLEESLCCASDIESPLPCLETAPNIRRIPFLSQNSKGSYDGTVRHNHEKYDLILFCHSMYGMEPKRRCIENALEMLAGSSQNSLVVVFHRDGVLELDGLVGHQTAVFPTGVISVNNEDEELDCFAQFLVGFTTKDTEPDGNLRNDWREMCRALGRRKEAHPNRLLYSAPNVMVAFTRHATSLPQLTAQVPLAKGGNTIENRDARLRRSTSIVRPTEVQQVQQCVRWALERGIGLTVVGGGHSGHCVWPAVVSIDMGAFNQTHICTTEEGGRSDTNPDSNSFVVVEAGCKTGDIIHKTMAAGLTVPLGARPSVGAGLWLQGGIGHLARLHGLACDGIVGAVVVSVNSGKIFCIGNVPSQHQPPGAISPENEDDMLWAMKGAGTNFGIVVSVTLKAYAALTYVTRNWIVPLGSNHEAQLRLGDFDRLVASKLRRTSSADGYLYWDTDRLHFGMTIFDSYGVELTAIPTPTPLDGVWGPEMDMQTVDGVQLFEADMYVSKMHGGHGGGKTSSFKRCLFLKDIGQASISHHLVAAMEARPTPLCYLHLLQGGGAVGDVAAEATAFGCRNWDFACVITGVWQRDQDGTETAQSTVRWVYNVAEALLSLSSGAYSADLGPDPRDAALATKAFGPNWMRLARLKRCLDPYNVLAHACPLPMVPKLILLITGESGVGKDYCAGVWVSVLGSAYKNLSVRVASISDTTKREYAAATGADLSRLLNDRAYKEEQRPALTAFFQRQVQHRPQLLEEHFLNIVYGAVGADVLLITGMREEAPVAALSHLVPDSRLLEVYVQATEQTRRVRREGYGGDENASENSSSGGLNYWPDLIFHNDTTGQTAAESFAERYLLRFFHADLQRLTTMVRSIPDFPRIGTEFRHVLGISQQSGGLALCTSLLQAHFIGDWSKVGTLVCCEVGGLVYASALALQVNLPLVLVREAGKLPPPSVSVIKPISYIASLAPNTSKEKQMEMERDVIPKGASVVVVDDVLSTGETLCAMLRLLEEAGISASDVDVMVVAEFPVHRGRHSLRRRGFGRTRIQSLLVFGGT
ncbi:hypothetical protein DM02DRAFT_687647 [Periconia macrospinosa]|uniref:FAD-binding PCMH-type domain-containing protein n=1 Tax=Periconia macrospinosa TaxID=97972 RepID=A0A2V1DH37_9PLEO|nr:hypothetical protein DM02DRAFT_687647 [Periconia macrospinosa]